MAARKVDPGIAGVRFSEFEFAWDWKSTQLIARSAGCSIDDGLDRPWMLPDSDCPGHLMLPFNGGILARNRAEVMERLIGGYDAWQDVGRWGSGGLRFLAPIPRAGRGRVGCGFTDVGATSKGHALVRFAYEVDDADSGVRLADGWMLLFVLGGAGETAGKIVPTRTAMPPRAPDAVVRHETPINVTFDWAMPSDDWNTTHFERKGTNPAPLVHGPRNMAMVLHDTARAFAGGRLERVRGITLGSLPAPLFPGEATETHLWNEGSGRFLGRLVVPIGARIDGGSGEKLVIDQIEMKMSSP